MATVGRVSSTADLAANFNVDQMPPLTFPGSTSGSVTVQAPAVAGTGTVVTLPAVTGTIGISSAPVAVGAAATVGAASTYLLDTAAGSVLTLPAATGSGRLIRALVKTTATSNAHKILPASSSDFMQGIAVGHVAAGTTLSFSGNAAASHSIQMPFAGTQPSGGFAGDWFEFVDAATNLWQVMGAYLAGTTSTTPFSTATT